MAKTTKTLKLLKASNKTVEKQPTKGFGKFANKLASAKQKKWENMNDTQKRLSESKNNNKMIKVSKKAKKFALLDDDEEGDMLGLTHRGKGIKDLKQFDDMNFHESDLENDQEFDKVQEKMNFAGFQATDNLLAETNPHVDAQRQQGQQEIHKSKNEIYKQIIEKSKAYKLFRQEQYEQNLNIATQLDENFDKLVGQLKFRNRDRKLQDKIDNRDVQYERLTNELKDDERVVSNKIIQKSEKLTERIRNKKNEQLKKLMGDGQGQDNDVRGWIEGEGDEEEISDDFASGSIDADDMQSVSEQEGDIEEQQGISADQIASDSDVQASYDELDDVNLSSSEQEQVVQQGKADVMQQQIEESGGDQGSVLGQDVDQLEYDEDNYSSSSLEQSVSNKKKTKGNKNKNKNKKIAKQLKNKPKSPINAPKASPVVNSKVIQQKLAAIKNKNRKLNTVL